MATKHLDLGCGKYPRNPYKQNELYAVDIIDSESAPGIKYSKCNIAIEKLPYPDSFFDSISAYDFLEHIPRVQLKDNGSRLPFIEAMNEIFRVLKPGGIFLALTPAFPKRSAFLDPTHVNFITKDTHNYFTAPNNWGQMYGYTGSFSVIRAGWCNFDLEVKEKTLKRKIVKMIYTFIPRFKQHFLWELKSNK